MGGGGCAGIESTITWTHMAFIDLRPSAAVNHGETAMLVKGNACKLHRDCQPR